MIPSYIVNLLVYFFIKTSNVYFSSYKFIENYKMARQLLKSRRFVQDTNHIETTNPGMISAS